MTTEAESGAEPDRPASGGGTEITEAMVDAARCALVESGALRAGLDQRERQLAASPATDPIRELARGILEKALRPSECATRTDAYPSPRP